MAKLTTKFVTKVQSDNIKVFWDDQLKGFGLCVRPSGKKTFLLKYRIGRGRRALCQKKSIGSLPVMSVEAARLKAKKFLFLASQGIDPIKKDQDFLTIKDLCNVIYRVIRYNLNGTYNVSLGKKICKYPFPYSIFNSTVFLCEVVSNQ